MICVYMQVYKRPCDCSQLLPSEACHTPRHQAREPPDRTAGTLASNYTITLSVPIVLITYYPITIVIYTG